jgi:FkbM family methyltransferase
MFVKFANDHSYIPCLIDKESVILDFGLNRGKFAGAVSPACFAVIGFEPDRSVIDERELPKNVEVVIKAVAAVGDRVTFFLGQDQCSSMHFKGTDTSTTEVPAISFSEAYTYARSRLVSLVKIDIEGEENAVLMEAPAHLLVRIPQITVEFHDFLDPESSPLIKTTIDRMRTLGFHVFRFSQRSYGDVLFVNKLYYDPNVVEKAWIFLRYKYIRGIFRIFARLFKLKHGLVPN